MYFYMRCADLVNNAMYLTRVSRYQRGNQNRKIEDGQITQWPSEKGLTTI